MKQVFMSNRGIITDEVPIPTPGDREILVEVKSSLISTGTEISGLKKQSKSVLDNVLKKKRIIDKIGKKLSKEGVRPTLSAIKNKLSPSEESVVLTPIGYSSSGIVVDKGHEVTGFHVGDRVACAGSGIAAHAEFVAVPVNLAVKFPDSISFEAACFTTVGSIALQGIRRANVNFGEIVVVTGLGLLGLLAVQIAKAWGLIVIGVDIERGRLELAKSLGADDCYLATENNVEGKIMEFTSGAGVDAVIIYAAAQSSEPINQGFRFCRKKGRVVLVGAVGMCLSREDMYEKELDFVISTSYGPGRYDPEYEIKGIDYPIGYVRWTENRNMREFLRLLTENKVQIDHLVSNVFPVEKASEAYKHLVKEYKSNITMLFSYGNKERGEEKCKKIVLDAKPCSKNKISVGVIGAGRFASAVRIPGLLKLKDYYHLSAIAEIKPEEAKMSGNKFKPQYVTTDYHDILNDESIDMVMITTRHNMHARMAIESLGSNKNVFVEKPLAINFEELHELKKAIEKSKCFLTVGFNRRYSPLSIRAKEIIDRLGGPLYINYRVNAGFIPKNDWVQDIKEGAGRIIGECCHFLDLFNYFIDSEIKDIKAVSIPIDNKAISSEDNVAVTVSYKNGSVAHLSYVSIGGRSMEKERIEIFCKQSSMLIVNFTKLEMYGTGEKNIKLNKMDKGHLRELKEFAKLIRGEESLILPLEKIFLSTEETFTIMESLKKS